MRRREFTARCPLMALSRHFDRTLECPLSGVKRTLFVQCKMSAFDPKRTSGCPLTNPA